MAHTFAQVPKVEIQRFQFRPLARSQNHLRRRVSLSDLRRRSAPRRHFQHEHDGIRSAGHADLPDHG